MQRVTAIRRHITVTSPFAAIFGLASLVLIISASAAPSRSGLLAHFGLDEGTGKVTYDSHTNHYKAGFSSTPTWVPDGKVNKALSFDGTDSVNIPSIPAVNNVSQVTVSAWMKRGSEGAKVVLGKQATNHDITIKLKEDGYAYFGMSNKTVAYGRVALSGTDWHHLTLVFNGNLTGNENRLKGYIDGVQHTLEFTGTVTNLTTKNTAAFKLGRTGTEYSAGEIDEFRLYNRALSDTEVVELGGSEPTEADVTPPSVPSPVNATALSSTFISVGWPASTDDSAVLGYIVYRDGVQVGTTSQTHYDDGAGITPSTTYEYTVVAYDLFNNQSLASAAASVTTSDDAPVEPVEGDFVVEFNESSDFYELFDTYAGTYCSADHTCRPEDISDSIKLFNGDHDHACQGPTTTRDVDITNHSNFFWWCAPGADPVKGHIMTGLNTSGYSIITFSPKQPFVDVSEVCWDQNLTDLGGGKWTNVVLVPEATYLSHPNTNPNRVAELEGPYRLDYTAPGFNDDNAPGAFNIQRSPTMGVQVLRGSMRLYTNNQTDNFVNDLGTGTFVTSDKAARYRHCMKDNGNNTITLTQNRPDVPGGVDVTTLPGSFPDGQVRVLFEDDTYDADKHGGTSTATDSRYTWHWDNILIR